MCRFLGRILRLRSPGRSPTNNRGMTGTWRTWYGRISADCRNPWPDSHISKYIPVEEEAVKPRRSTSSGTALCRTLQRVGCIHCWPVHSKGTQLQKSKKVEAHACFFWGRERQCFSPEICFGRSPVIPTMTDFVRFNELKQLFWNF